MSARTTKATKTRTTKTRTTQARTTKAGKTKAGKTGAADKLAQAAKVRLLGEQPYLAHQLRSYRLDNGLTIRLLQDPSAPVVSYQTWFQVGSANEQPGKTGLAHFLEHLMFLGTPKFEAGVLDELLEDVGGDNNAATWTDWTYYQDDVPEGCLDVVMQLEADRMRGLSLEPDDVDAERQVVLSERRDRVDDDVDGVAGEQLWKHAFRKHAYGHPTLGWQRDIEHLSVADCRAFHTRWYAPSNATVVVAGAFDELSLLRAIRKNYQDLRRTRVRRRTPTAPAGQRTERSVELTLAASAPRVFVGYRGPGYRSREWVVLRVLSEILFGGRGSRAYRSMVLETELATSAWADLPPFAEACLFEIGAIGSAKSSPAALLKAIDAHVAHVVDRPCTDEEVERACARIELSLLTSLETVGGRAEQVGFHSLVSRDPTGALERAEAYRSVTPAEVQHVAKSVLVPRRRTVVRVTPG